MVKKRCMSIVLWIIHIILLVLLACLMAAGLKAVMQFAELHSINEIWPAGEFIMYKYGMIGFAIAFVVCFVRMLIIDFEKNMLKSKVTEMKIFPKLREEEVKEDMGDDVTTEETRPIRLKMPKLKIPVKTENEKMEHPQYEEESGIKTENKRLRQWRKIANLLYPELEEAVQKFVDDHPFGIEET